MMNNRILLALLLGSAFVTAPALAQVKTIDLGTGSRPESITKAWGGKYYVSLQGTTGNGDGKIVQIDIAKGTVTPFVSTGLDNPRGLAFTGELLFVTDTAKVWKIDQAGKVTLAAPPEAYPQPPIFFNDAAPEHGGHAVFVTEMGPGRAVQRDPSGFLWPSDSPQADAIPTGARVYRIGTDGKVTNVFTPTRKILVTNGVTEAKTEAKKGKGLLALDFFHGSVVEVDTQHDSANILATGPFRGCDGVEQTKDGTIFVTSFENGRLWRMDASGNNVKKLLDLDTDLHVVARQTLADLTVDEEAKKLYIPDTLHGTLVIVPLP
jgi:sugar lactone lactonase YvrE